MPRHALIIALTAIVFASPTAATAQDVVPLGGQGENIAPVARVLIPRATEVEMAGDWAFVATDAGEEGEGGLTIVNVADPAKPFIEGTWTAEMGGLRDGSYGDVDLSPDGNLAVITNAHCGTCAEGQVAWAVLLDVSDKAKPTLARQDRRRRDDGLRPHRRRSTTRRSTSTRRCGRCSRRTATPTSPCSTSPTRPRRSRRAS